MTGWLSCLEFASCESYKSTREEGDAAFGGAQPLKSVNPSGAMDALCVADDHDRQQDAGGYRTPSR
jgi:short subunit dehydrogenase-like uncharacterized protein